jgi:hypothetical protein
VEQELHTLPENMSSLAVINGVCVAQSLVFCVVFCKDTPYASAAGLLLLISGKFILGKLKSSLLSQFQS